LIAILAIATAVPALVCGQTAAALDVGDQIVSTTVKMKNVDESQVSIADVAGAKGTLVLFTCNACPFVKAWEERIATLGNQFRAKGIGVIAVNSNDPSVNGEDSFARMQERARNRGFEFPYAVDAGSRVAQSMGATRTPEAFLFDAKGKLVYHGVIDDNAHAADDVEQHYLRDALQALVDGTEVAVKTTKALGCTIKFYPEAGLSGEKAHQDTSSYLLNAVLGPRQRPGRR
jgi:peroxiredoxin